MAISVRDIQSAQEKTAAEAEKIIDAWLVHNAKTPIESSHYQENVPVGSRLGSAVQNILRKRYLTPNSGWKSLDFRESRSGQGTEVVMSYKFG